MWKRTGFAKYDGEVSFSASAFVINYSRHRFSRFLNRRMNRVKVWRGAKGREGVSEVGVGYK